MLRADATLAMRLPTENLRVLCDPFKDSPWGCEVTRDMVKFCIENDLLLCKPVEQDDEKAEWGSVNAHAARVAFLVTRDDWEHEPISIDVGIPHLGFYVDWIIVDGNHRFAASLYKGRAIINAEVSGQIDYAEKLLGCPIS